MPPSKVKLSNIPDTQPEKGKALQSRIERLSAESARPLFMEASFKAIFDGRFGPAPILTKDNTVTAEP